MGRKLSDAELKSILGVDFLAFLIGLVDGSADTTRGVFTFLKKPYNRTVGASMLRMLVRDGLREAQGSQYSEVDHGFVQQFPRNLAIWFEFEGVVVRGYTVPKGRLPLKGNSSPDHRERFFGNVEPEERTLMSKPWVANVALLWSFDKHGNFIGLRAVVGDGWDDAGQLKLALDLPLKTTVAEFLAEETAANFQPEEDGEPLIKVRKPVEEKPYSDPSAKPAEKE